MNHERALAWARRHIEKLHHDIEQFEDDQDDALATEPDGAPGEYLVKWRGAIEPIDEDWVFRIGDAIHGIRVALDWLTFSIVKPSTQKEIRNTLFPICFDATKWTGLAKQRLPNVSPNVADAFYTLQPCSRASTNPTVHIYHSPTGGFEPLAVLDELENIHKHRHPLRVDLASPSRGYVGWGTPNFDVVERFTFSASVGAPVFRVRLKTPSENGPNHHFHAPIHVCFEKGGAARGLPVVAVLNALHNHVADVIFRDLAAFV